MQWQQIFLPLFILTISGLRRLRRLRLLFNIIVVVYFSHHPLLFFMRVFLARASVAMHLPNLIRQYTHTHTHTKREKYGLNIKRMIWKKPLGMVCVSVSVFAFAASVWMNQGSNTCANVNEWLSEWTHSGAHVCVYQTSQPAISQPIDRWSPWDATEKNCTCM